MSKKNIRLFYIGISISFILFISGCAGHKKSVKLFIYPEVTTQSKILNAFGKPNSVMYEHERVIWIYERTAKVVRSSKIHFALYFNDSGASNNNSSSKPVKLMIYFDNSGIVKNYSVQFSDLKISQ